MVLTSSRHCSLKYRAVIGNFFLSLTICKVFSKVTATLDPNELNISPHEVAQLLDKIKAKIGTGMSFEYKEQYFLIHGSLRVINDCQLLLQKYLMPDENISDKLGNCSLNVEDVSAGKERAINKTLTSKTSDCENTGVIIATPVYDVAEEKDLKSGKIDTEKTEGVAHPLISDIQTFNTDPLAVSFIRQFYTKQVQDISKDCLVSFDVVNSDTQVTLKPTQDCDPVKYNEACSRFVMVLDSASQGMSTRELDLKGKDKEVVVSLIQHLSSKFPVILDQLQENGPFVVYGDNASVEQVKLSLEERMHEQTVGADVLFEAQQMALAGPESVSIVTYSCCTESGVNISLRYGDITSENVDAIVNPANEFLQHIAGLAGHIVQKGGPDIQSESDELISEKRRGRPLSLGEAVYTKAGNLPCKYVIHAVGPEWEKQSKKKTINLLHTACVESLKLASKLCLSSIALPAISSGLFGVPIDLCASSMLNGVEQYLEQLKKTKLQKKEDAEKADVKGTKAEKKKSGKETMKKASEQKTGGVKEQEGTTLVDIRFVLIDADAMDVFEKECVKRFSEKQTNPSGDDESL